MNVADSETVLGILQGAGYGRAAGPEGAAVVLLNTCAIREGAEAKVWGRLRQLRSDLRPAPAARRGEGPKSPRPPVVGVLGCMAERLKGRLLEGDRHAGGRLADLVVGPDAYRDLPLLVGALRRGDARTAMNVQLSLEETYADVAPVREAGATSAFVSIMRGCNNMCAFCIVPFTRGRERSRAADSIVAEVRRLSAQGVREVTLLGQNVNSYSDGSSAPARAPEPRAGGERGAGGDGEGFDAHYARGFASVYRPRRRGETSFAELLGRVAAVDPEMRVRYTSPHPKEFSDDVLEVVARHPNVCMQLHMPAQSGSSRMLEAMRRGYSREAYSALARRIRGRLPGVSLSSDFIAGFCGETEADHQATMELLEEVGFEHAFIFAYSRREKTRAARHLQDDVPEAVKKRRLGELLAVFRREQARRFAAEVGRLHLVLVEGPSKHSTPERPQLQGRTCTNVRVVFDDGLAGEWAGSGPQAGRTAGGPGGPVRRLAPGDYAACRVQGVTSATLHAEVLGRTTLQGFFRACGTTVPRESEGEGESAGEGFAPGPRHGHKSTIPMRMA